MIRELLGKSLKKDGLQWSAYTRADHIVDRFSTSDWLRIFPMYPTEQEFRKFKRDTRRVVRVLILKNTVTGQPLGFVALIFFSPRTIAVHGGAWANTIGNRIDIYRGLFILFNRLLANGAKIVSSSSDNPRAVRFMKSIGFRIFSYRYSLTHYHLTLSGMLKSPVYQRFAHRR